MRKVSAEAIQRFRKLVSQLKPARGRSTVLFHPSVLQELAPGMTLEEFAARPGCRVIKPDDDA